MRADLLLLVVFVALVLDSRRLHALARSTLRARRDSTAGGGIPAGANPDQVGITLRHIQMRVNVDWEDGGAGWDGPEILPGDETEPAPVGDEPAETGTPPVPEPSSALPILWKPVPALPPAGGTARWCQPDSTTSSSTAPRPPVTTAA